MSNLKDNVSSDWIKVSGLFGHTPDRVRTMLYVEGDDDVPFWTKAVEKYQEKYDIIVTTNKSVKPEEGNG